MKIKDLKELIEILDDEIEVVISGSDHSYLKCSAALLKAEFYKSSISEYYNEQSRSSKDSKIALILWVG